MKMGYFAGFLLLCTGCRSVRVDDTQVLHTENEKRVVHTFTDTSGLRAALVTEYTFRDSGRITTFHFREGTTLQSIRDNTAKVDSMHRQEIRRSLHGKTEKSLHKQNSIHSVDSVKIRHTTAMKRETYMRKEPRPLPWILWIIGILACLGGVLYLFRKPLLRFLKWI